MFRLYSKGCEYAIRALMQFAPGEGQAYLKAQEICERARVPESFARKMFQALARDGFLETTPGPTGGYKLSRPADKIGLLSIIKAVDGSDALDGCILGLPKCGDDNACALHCLWMKAKKSLLPELEATTLKDLLRLTKKRGRGAKA